MVSGPPLLAGSVLSGPIHSQVQTGAFQGRPGFFVLTLAADSFIAEWIKVARFVKPALRPDRSQFRVNATAGKECAQLSGHCHLAV